jgi:hypothetical protein
MESVSRPRKIVRRSVPLAMNIIPEVDRRSRE